MMIKHDLNIKDLKTRIKNRESIIGIIGLGYVGLPLVIRFAEEGFKTIGFDVDKEKVKKLNVGKSYINSIDSKKIKNVINNKLKATTNFSNI